MYTFADHYDTSQTSSKRPIAMQANYAAANAALDVLAAEQACTGATTIAVQWGAWSAVGAESSAQVAAQPDRMSMADLSSGNVRYLAQQSRMRPTTIKTLALCDADSLSQVSQQPVRGCQRAQLSEPQA